MRKCIIIFLTIITLFLFTTCGIPNMFVPDDSSVSITKITDTNRVKFKINSSYLLDNANNRYYSPEVNLFYIIRGSNNTDIYSSLLSSFNNAYCNYPYCNPITGSKTDGEPLVTYNKNDVEYGLFQFYENDSLIEKNYLYGDSFNMEFYFNEEEGLVLRIYDEDYTNLILPKRELRRSYDGKKFVNVSSLNDGEELRGEYIEPVEVVIYASITFSFTNYTNIWNSKLSSYKELFSFTLP